MKTPMQEHIEWLKKERKKLDWVSELGIAVHIGGCIEHAESLLEKEKEVMCEFAKYCLDKALDLDVRTAYINVEEYYYKTFKTKEK